MAEDWRSRLQPASFRGVQFYVDVQSRTSGRRLVPHEFPKRDVPYTEDMGRRVRKFSVTVYVIGPDYASRRDALVRALENEVPGQLKLPTDMQAGVVSVNVDNYTLSEDRTKGGYATFDIAFIESGVLKFVGADSGQTTDTKGTADNAAEGVKSSAGKSAVKTVDGASAASGEEVVYGP